MKSKQRISPGGLILKDQLISINRVTKVVKGGKNLSFAALVVIGMQPPNEKAAYVVGGMVVVLAVTWFAVARKTFPGPPRVIESRERAEAIAAAEAAVHQGEKGARP